MEELGNRIQELRKQIKFSQTDLSDKIGLSKSQMISYENKGVQPPADNLNKLVDLFRTSSVDFLINVDSQDKAKASINNNTLLQHFEEVENLSEDEQSTVIKFLIASIRDFKAIQASAA